MFAYIYALLLIYFISFTSMYIISNKVGKPVVIPGDYYKIRGDRRIYLPFSSAFAITVIVFLFMIWIKRNI